MSIITYGHNWLIGHHNFPRCVKIHNRRKDLRFESLQTSRHATHQPRMVLISSRLAQRRQTYIPIKILALRDGDEILAEKHTRDAFDLEKLLGQRRAAHFVRTRCEILPHSIQ